MALFGKADQDLPYLTRFYQVEEIKPELFSEMSVYDEDFTKTELAAFFFADEIRYNPSVTSSAGVTWLPSFYKMNSELHRGVKILLDALADDDLIDTSVVSEILTNIHSKRNEEVPIITITTDGILQVVVQDLPNIVPEQVRAREVRFTSFPVFESHAREQIIGELKALLDPYFNSDQSQIIRRCEECNNPFIAQRSDQIFCSHRCGTRAGIRRRRRSAKESQDVSLKK